jgi:hypothetical protein
MNTPKEDWEIRQLFERLRSEESIGRPEFRQVLARAGVRSAGSSFHLNRRWLAAALPAVLVLLWVGLGEISTPEEPALDVSHLEAWESPTDFLLETEVNLVIASVPELETGLWSSEAVDSAPGDLAQ